MTGLFSFPAAGRMEFRLSTHARSGRSRAPRTESCAMNRACGLFNTANLEQAPGVGITFK